MTLTSSGLLADDRVFQVKSTENGLKWKTENLLEEKQNQGQREIKSEEETEEEMDDSETQRETYREN